jgi:hypothetical protein
MHYNYTFQVYRLEKHQKDCLVWPRWKALAETLRGMPKFRKVWDKTKHVHNSDFIEFMDSLCFDLFLPHPFLTRSEIISCQSKNCNLINRDFYTIFIIVIVHSLYLQLQLRHKICTNLRILSMIHGLHQV